MTKFFSLLLLQLLGVYFSLEPGTAAPLLSPTFAPASAPVAAENRLSNSETPSLAPVSSVQGGGSSSSTGPKKPEPPKPRPGGPGPRPLPLPPKKPAGTGSGSSSPKASSPAHSPAASGTSLTEVTSTEVDDELTLAKSVASSPRSSRIRVPWIPTKVSIRGEVSCRKCNVTGHHHQVKKDKGLSDVLVELTCPLSKLDTITDQHGRYKMEFRHTMPEGFNQSCTVTVDYSTLPHTCKVPTVVNEIHVPVFHRSSRDEIAFHVPTFKFISSSCQSRS